MTDYSELFKELQADCEQLKTENKMLYNTITADKGVMLERIKFLEQQMPKRGEWVHGREIGKEWIYDHWVEYYEDWHCSNCKVVVEQEEKPKYNFCPNCGAKMTEVQE